MADPPSNSGHNAMCLRVMQLMPQIARGLRRSQDLAAPQTLTPLGPRHVAALGQLREEPLTVGALASRLGLTLSTVSGVLADLDRAGFVTRTSDAGDRRRTIVQISPAKAAEIEQWLDGAAQPMSRVLDQLAPDEQAVFLKAMGMLAAELRTHDAQQ
ncbi:MarR family transcriptional regulator [Streptomyces phaeochromogenes]|uniref:MarR family transcriptional regulator n=1 Tax=Streptomyces phaeochromogenes TaxID=1923 RepID=A0ABZ1H723_STRPH|nr:MarR family transcriptional regulator [Streptomyces phaeochromogenes]WSD14341.1 MarR family transcriptional regulator [Streptomyces phaeochromogenes]